MTLSELRSAVRFKIFRDSSDTTYSDTDLDRNLNQWYRTALMWAIQVNGEWQVNQDMATTDIVADQRKYALPTDILKLNEVYIKYANQPEHVRAYQRDPKVMKQFDSSEPTQSDYGYFPPQPEFDLSDNAMFIYLPVTEIESVTDGLKIYYQTELTALSATDDEPNMPEAVQNLLIEGTSFEFYDSAEMFNKRDRAEKRIYNFLKPDLEKLYSERSTVKRYKINPVRKNYE